MDIVSLDCITKQPKHRTETMMSKNMFCFLAIALVVLIGTAYAVPIGITGVSSQNNNRLSYLTYPVYAGGYGYGLGGYGLGGAGYGLGLGYGLGFYG